MPLFKDPVHDEFSSWVLGFAPYGGGDVGEVEWLATQVKAGDDDSFFEAFSGYAARRIEEGDAAAAKGTGRPLGTATNGPRGCSVSPTTRSTARPSTPGWSRPSISRWPPSTRR